jgi:hypothetical protein
MSAPKLQHQHLLHNQQPNLLKFKKGLAMNWSKFFMQVALVVFILFLNSLFVMLLWNMFLISAINGINEIGFIQAMGLTGLAGILFKDNGSIKAKFDE